MIEGSTNTPDVARSLSNSLLIFDAISDNHLIIMGKRAKVKLFCGHGLAEIILNQLLSCKILKKTFVCRRRKENRKNIVKFLSMSIICDGIADAKEIGHILKYAEKSGCERVSVIPTKYK